MYGGLVSKWLVSSSINYNSLKKKDKFRSVMKINRSLFWLDIRQFFLTFRPVQKCIPITRSIQAEACITICQGVREVILALGWKPV